MNVMKYLLVLVAGYLLGSVSVSVLLSRGVLGGDVRSRGSGNAGATNMARVYGMKAGVLTLAGDMLKALLAMGLGTWLLGDLGLCLGGIACIVGHCFPVFHQFKGGKGISVGAAIGITIASLIFHVSTPKLILAVFGMVLAVFQHRENIKRLIQGTEKDFKAARGGKPSRD